MEGTVSRAFDSWERPETLCNETNLVQRTEIERPLFLNLQDNADLSLNAGVIELVYTNSK